MDGRIHLTADGECRSQGAEHREDRFRARGRGAWPGPRPAEWRQRKRRSVPAESERYTACVKGSFFYPFSLSLLSAGATPTLMAPLQAEV